jgi:hypothetical protein
MTVANAPDYWQIIAAMGGAISGLCLFVYTLITKIWSVYDKMNVITDRLHTERHVGDAAMMKEMMMSIQKNTEALHELAHLIKEQNTKKQ